MEEYKDNFVIHKKYRIIEEWKVSSKNKIFFIQIEESKEFALMKYIDKGMYNLYQKLLELPHKNLVKIIDTYLIEDKCVVIEEYIKGETLENKLVREGGQPLSVAEKFLIDLCDGLTFLHKNDIIHRDLSLKNILVTQSGDLKICDYDISRTIKEEGKQDTAVLGTAGYAAPEQFGYAQTDQRSDIYSLGVVLNYILTGVHPHITIYNLNRKYKNIIIKATSMDKNDRYKKVSQIKELVTGKVSKESPLYSSLLSMIPGYRSQVWWKILIATFFYIMLILAIFSLI